MMKASSRLLSVVLAGIWLCAGLSAMAQKPLDKASADERKLIEIKVTGSKRFPEEAIAAATDLQLGKQVFEEDFKQAAHRLGDMGVFSDVGYTYSYSFEGTKLELHVTDAAKFVPARFEDFVWFSDADLMRRIKERVPLFDGSLPLSGDLADEVSDLLQAMLVESAIPGNVEYTRVGASDGPVQAIVYKVSNVLIRVRNIEFTGAGPEELPALEQAARNFSEREYSRSRLEALAQHQFLPVYHAQGYLKASFGEPQPKVVKPPSTESDEGPRNQTVVDVTFAVTPGAQYKLKNLEWSGNHEFPSSVLGKMIRDQTGQPANTLLLADNLKDVQKLYGSHGYVTTTIKAAATYDDASATVAMRLEVDEGNVYHMGDLEFRGLDNSLTAKLRNAWKLRAGDVYDSTYLSEYLPAAQKLLPAAFDWDVSSHVTANVREKTVDVDLIYSVKVPK